MSSSDQKGKKPSNTYSEKEQWDDDLDLPPIDHQKVKIKKPILEKAAFDKKKKKNLKPFIAIGLLFLMVSIYIFMSEDNKTQNPKLSENSMTEPSTIENQPVDETEDLAQKEQDEEGKEEELNETWPEDTVIVEELLSAEIMQEDLTGYESPKNYHIIVGSFKDENNAKSWIKEKAFTEYGMQSIREFEGWYRVIFLSYSSVEQAEIEIDSIRTNLNLKAWIAYMK